MSINKKCIRCQAVLGLCEFNKDKSHADGLRSRCRDCTRKLQKIYNSKPDVKARRREYQREALKSPEVRRRYTDAMRRWRERNPHDWRERRFKRLYGISVADWSAILERQGGKCAICLVSFSSTTPQTDHCHKSGRVRGILCQACNKGLGCLRDNTNNLQNALTYLGKTL